MLNNSIKRIGIIPLLCVVALCTTLFFAITFSVGGTAKALEYMSEVILTVADSDDDDGKVKEILPGGEFTLTITARTERENEVWASLTLYIGPMNDDGQTMNDDICKYLSFDGVDQNAWYNPSNPWFWYYNVTNDWFGSTTPAEKGLAVQVAYGGSGSKVSTDTDFVMTATIKLSEDYDVKDDDGNLVGFKFGFQPTKTNHVGFGTGSVLDGGSENLEGASGLLKTDYVTINVRQPGENATLDKLTVGHDADGSVPSSFKTFSVEDGAENPLLAPDAEGQMAYVSDSKKLNNFIVTPVSTDDFATIEISLKPFASSDDTDGDSSDSSDGAASDDSSDSGDGAASDGSTDPDIVTVTSGKSATLTLAGGQNKLYIRVTSEDGKNQLIYTVDVPMAYVRLESVTASSNSPTDGAKTSFKDTFDPDTEEDIIVYVPSDFDKTEGVKISATVLTGYGAGDTVTAVATNCSVNDGSLSSGGDVFVNNFAETLAEGESYKLVLTALASNGTERAYNIVFEMVSVDSTMTLKAIGKDTEKELENNSALATTNDADFYFFLTTEKSGEARFEITYAEGATVTIDGVAYYNEAADTEGGEEGEGTPDPDSGLTTVDDEDVSTDGSDEDDGTESGDTTVNAKNNFYGEGTYKIIVTAEAGNATTYVVILANQTFLKIASDSNYQFITEYEETMGSLSFYYRRAYPELKNDDDDAWEHGRDDTDLDRIVIGQVLGMTTVNSFISNFDESQRNSIRLYNNSDTLIYDCGKAPDGINESTWDNMFVYVVATGWYVQLIVGDEVVDTAYVSVLGDVDKDGTVSANDIAIMISYLSNALDLATPEQKLAGYIGNNTGLISANDAALLVSVVGGNENIESFFYSPAADTDTET